VHRQRFSQAQSVWSCWHSDDSSSLAILCDGMTNPAWHSAYCCIEYYCARLARRLCFND